MIFHDSRSPVTGWAKENAGKKLEQIGVKTSAVYGPHLQPSAAEEVDQTSAQQRRRKGEEADMIFDRDGERRKGVTGVGEFPFNFCFVKRQKRLEVIGPSLYHADGVQTFHCLRASKKQTAARALLCYSQIKKRSREVERNWQPVMVNIIHSVNGVLYLLKGVIGVPPLQKSVNGVPYLLKDVIGVPPPQKCMNGVPYFLKGVFGDATLLERRDWKARPSKGREWRARTLERRDWKD
ncbi:hypothetical protein LXL04_001786 [Taraxacum kok-saghyz]